MFVRLGVKKSRKDARERGKERVSVLSSNGVSSESEKRRGHARKREEENDARVGPTTGVVLTSYSNAYKLAGHFTI